MAACTFLLGACAFTGKSESVPTPEPAVVMTFTPEPTATPAITYGEWKLVDAGQSALPTGYTLLPANADGLTMFAFTDTAGERQYRVFGGYDELTNGAVTNLITGFYACDEAGARDPSAEPVNTASEPLGVCTPCALPETIRLRAGCTNVDGNGHVTNAAGAHFVFGKFSETDEGAFYPADASGSMIPGALVSEESLSVPSYVPLTAPTTEGERYLIVFIGTQSVVSFLAKDGEWTIERIMACSTGRAKDMTPRGNFKIMRQYLYKKMGKVAGENVFSQYASRITGSYLFHSVPIAGDKRNSQEYGRRQMVLKYYERLGTVASGGCVRLRCADAYWIYMTCEVGTPVTITDDMGPAAPTPPALIYEEPYITGKDLGWDPSDPDPENPYHAVYEPEFVASYKETIDKSDPTDNSADGE